jgi:predicted dehydrogenase
VFIEKPLADRLEGAEEMLAAAAALRLLVMAGYNLRFHAALRKVRELAQGGAVGRVLTVRAEYGQYLPTWRPGHDYRSGYITRRETGGGIILEESHELDYVAWLGGRIMSVYAAAGKLSDLDMSAEDTALMVLRLEGGALGEIHVDCVQREYSRSCKVVGTEGTVTWTYGSGIRLSFAGREPESWPINPDPNEMYLDEMRCFLEAIDGRQAPPVDGRAALQNLTVALAARESAGSRREVAVG